MSLGTLTVSIGGDTSGLKSALDEAASLAAQFAADLGKGVVGEIAGTLGSLLVQQPSHKTSL